MKYIAFFIAIVFFVSCNTNTNKGSIQECADVYHIEYAKGFDIKKYENYTEVTVNDPWDSTKILQKYILVDRDNSVPDNLPEGTLIRTPLTSVAAYSTIHCTVLSELNMLNIVKGVCEPHFVDIDYIQKGVKNGTIEDLGMASNPNIEKIILVDPDAIMATPIHGLPYGSIAKTKIPMIETPDYMESSPLGRAEWIKFYSAFIGKEQLADSIFKQTVERYNTIKDKMASINYRPTVFSDHRYGNVWYTAGGKSYMGNMLKDAGANYIWSDNENTGSLPLSFEEVLDKAGEAQFWLIKYNQPNNLSYKQLEEEYKPYSNFAAFKNKNIYGCNTGYATYYEDLPIHPDYVLEELAHIFHPEIFPDYRPKYYNKLED
ncbi:ABC transporter substrate-binding protein [Dysgonomonas sp. 216]|uniref:ABC transporter substrate-binding protein n=1 Tax=Dysgonomonas sp. 216 TaxID=2302934 RepID=UPI0013D81E23|nr:ABC transporter substrate-binding protein [Dysgonomonas sp. 216]NDW18042.1 ABC transporter substrate-binding protein [Dysgonomonas sp. 216]